MKYILEIAEDKTAFAEEFFKTISFVKNVKAIAPNEVTNTRILQSIDSYEKGKVVPMPISLSELKALIDA